MTKRRSARGEMVDFDLLRIKEQIAAGPKPVNVKSREEFIDRKIRRRAKKSKVSLPTNASGVQLADEEDIADEVVVPPPRTTRKIKK